MPHKIIIEHVAVERPAVNNARVEQVRILSDVNISIPAGGRVAIYGPSGSGKTSLLRLLNRLDEPAEGRILLDNVDISQLDPITLRRRVGMLFQQPHLFDATVKENLEYPLQLCHRTLSDETAMALLTELGLPADFLTRRVQQLSGGQQQRVALARAFALEPEVLLLDEPTSALDEESAHLLMEALHRRNAERALTLVMITHSKDMLRRLDGMTVFVHDGRVDVVEAGLVPADATGDPQEINE